MSDTEQKLIFSRNLNKFLSQNNKTQKEVADSIGVSPQTFNTWCQGIALPRMGKVQLLADYFGIEKSDLIDDKSDDRYYLNEETAAVAQEIFDNPDLRLLFDASRNATPEDLRTARDVLLALKRKEHNWDNEGC